MSKIKKEQLEELQKTVNTINYLQGEVGRAELQKQKIISQLFNVESEMTKVQKSLEEEYGKVSININDGTYEVIEEEEVVEGK